MTDMNPADQPSNDPDQRPDAEPSPADAPAEAESPAGTPANARQGDAVSDNAQNPSNPGEPQKPEYGAMLSDYPGWNPYVYGAPEGKNSSRRARHGHDADDDLRVQGAQTNPSMNDGGPFAANGNPANGNPNSQPYAGQRPNPYGTPAGNPYGNPYGYPYGMPYGGGFFDDPDDPRFPRQGQQWDPLAIAAIVMTFFMPIFGLVFGLISMRRTRVFHLRGHGLAVASVVLSILSFVLTMWLMQSGYFDPLFQSLTGDGGQGSGPGASSGAGGTPSPTDSGSGSSGLPTSTDYVA